MCLDIQILLLSLSSRSSNSVNCYNFRTYALKFIFAIVAALTRDHWRFSDAPIHYFTLIKNKFIVCPFDSGPQFRSLLLRLHRNTDSYFINVSMCQGKPMEWMYLSSIHWQYFISVSKDRAKKFELKCVLCNTSVPYS